VEAPAGKQPHVTRFLGRIGRGEHVRDLFGLAGGNDAAAVVVFKQTLQPPMSKTPDRRSRVYCHLSNDICQSAGNITAVNVVQVLCAVCGGPMVTIGTDPSWVGHHRAIRRWRIFPVCSECAARERDQPGFLYAVLCQLTRPSLAIRGVIHGGRRGDGRPRGLLRVVRMPDGSRSLSRAACFSSASGLLRGWRPEPIRI
jgi:hypothetical protein